MEGREIVDAQEFFEKGGVYENRESDGADDIELVDLTPDALDALFALWFLEMNW
jgi:hypothetical protein